MNQDATAPATLPESVKECEGCIVEDRCMFYPSEPYCYRTATLNENKRVLDAICKINIEDNVCKKGKDCKSCAWQSLRTPRRTGK